MRSELDEASAEPVTGAQLTVALQSVSGDLRVHRAAPATSSSGS
jgi:hypothetical protein